MPGFPFADLRDYLSFVSSTDSPKPGEKAPRITVLMPVFNAEAFVGEAIESILRQTYPDFELLIIDDGSTDRSSEIIRSFQDSRIRYLRNEQNLRLIRTLNRGIGAARGEYLARMDADDISFPQRLERQLHCFEENPGLGVCGSYAIRINERGTHGALIQRPSGRRIAESAWLPTPLLHPTVMMRTELARKYLYDETALHCEDYDLWIRMAKDGVQFENFPAPLLYYRLHGGGVSLQNRALQLQNSFRVFQRHHPLPISFEEYCALIGIDRGISLKRRLRFARTLSPAGGAGAFFFQLYLHLKGILRRRRAHG